MRLTEGDKSILEILAKRRSKSPGGVLVYIQHIPEGKRMLRSLCRRKLIGRFGKRDPMWGQEYKITPRGRACLDVH